MTMCVLVSNAGRLHTGAPFPTDFRDVVVKTIFRRLFRVYAHIYHSHFQMIVKLKEDAHLNTCFKHFALFTLVRSSRSSCCHVTSSFSSLTSAPDENTHGRVVGKKHPCHDLKELFAPLKSDRFSLTCLATGSKETELCLNILSIPFFPNVSRYVDSDTVKIPRATFREVGRPPPSPTNRPDL
jgi:hypothetical protein